MRRCLDDIGAAGRTIAVATNTVLRDIVGRHDELAVVSRFLRDDFGAVALTIEGEAGIGKTTLWRTGVAMAQERSYTVLSCRPSAAEVRLSYAALGDLLVDVLPDALPRLPEPQRHALAVSLALEEPGPRAPDRRVIALALLSVLSTVARDGPVLVAIDDVQWLDRPSAAVLEFVGRRLEGGPVKVLLAERREAAADASPLVQAFPEEMRAKLVVGPLALGALHRIITSRLGVSLPRPSLVRVHEITAGNPFYALEIAKPLSDGSIGYDDPLPVPATLLDLVARRLAGLPRRMRAVLEVVAMLSDPTVTIVEAALPSQDTRLTVDRGISAGLLERRGDRIRFTHPLLAVAVARELDPARRRRLHRKLAQLLSDPEERARHLALAATGPSDEAAQALDVAAQHAAARGSPTTAFELADLAVALTPPNRPAETHRRRIASAVHRIPAGDKVGARRTLEQLIDELPAGGRRAEALFHVSRTRLDDVDAQRRLAAQALQEASDEALRIRILQQLSNSSLLVGDMAAALAHARAAFEAAEVIGDDWLFASSAAQLGVLETFDGDVTPGLLERAVEIEPNTDYLAPKYQSPTLALGHRLQFQGTRLDTARELLLRADTSARAHGDHGSRPWLHLAELEIAAGEWERATAYAVEGYEIMEQYDAPQAQSALLYAWALARTYLGDVEQARALAERGLALARSTKSVNHEINNMRVLGFLDLSLGDAEAAAAHLLPVVSRSAAMRYGRAGVARRLPDAVDALIMGGQLGHARRLLEQLELLARELEFPAVKAAALRSRGLLRAAEGDPLGALEPLERALELDERSPLPFERGRTLLALGETRRRAGRKRAAREALHSAVAIFDQLGARLWAARARAELGRISGRAETSDALTGTQARIAELVAAGRTNREVAAALFVSERTVEGHLTRIYDKLGVRSRAELAHRFANVPR
jgi:DNA-binding CsgD family transcriptional regulator